MIRPALLSAASLCALSAAAQAQAPALRGVDVPQPFGHVVGDVVRMNLVIDWPAGWEFDRDGLPPTDREDRVIELRRHHVEPAGEICAGCRRIALDWQIFKSVRAADEILTPAFSVRLRSGTQVASLPVAPQALSVAPLTAWEAKRNWLETMRPGYRPVAFDVGGRVLMAVAWLAAALLALALWAWASGHWPAGGPARPFALALREVRRRRRASHGDTLAQDLRSLHAAFNRCAGEAVFADDLARFFEQRPALAPMADEARRIFAASREQFFGDRAPHLAADDITALLRRLARAEPRLPASEHGRLR